MITVRDRREDAPKSFTDETSPKFRKSDRKVSIHGQVIRDNSLKWFRDLVKLYPNDNPETKSTRILEQFHTLPQEFRARTWVGMKKVRIHIVDSLPYQTDYKAILKNVFKTDDIRKMLESDARKGNEFAKYVWKRMDETVTEWIIKDSTSYRLRDMMEPNYPRGSLSYYLRPLTPRREKPIDLKPFRTKVSSMTSKAVKVASQSASVFTPAMDRVTPMMRNFGDSWGHYEVQRTLQDSHAFDQGDDKSLKWIDDQRKEIGRNGWMPSGIPDYVDDFGEYETFNDYVYGKLYNVPSHESEYVQAADIAAGFARVQYEQYNIAAVADRFEYVTINGERITHDNAEERFEYWRQLHEREKRNTPLIIVSN